MERLTLERCNGIKRGYWSPAKKEDLVQRLAAYEDTGLEPEEIEVLKVIHGLPATEIARICNIYKADREGRVVVLEENAALAIAAGAYAIDKNKRLFGAFYCYDIFGKHGGPKQLSYYEAAKILYELSEKALGGGGDV